MTTPPIVVSGEGTLYPPGREYWTSPDMIRNGEPLYRVGDVARHFFAKSPVWLRMRMHRGFGGQDDLGDIKIPKTNTGWRMWSLYAVERMARSFLMERALSLDEFSRTINVVKAMAHLYGFDIGQGDPLAARFPYQLDPIRAQATEAVLERLLHEDTGFAPTAERQAAEEHLVARTVWSMQALEDYYRGVVAGD